ncbi:hypothetical protein K8I61_13265 [bacterium]|nr:hypothetical protein [bacterium]
MKPTNEPETRQRAGAPAGAIGAAGAGAGARIFGTSPGMARRCEIMRRIARFAGVAVALVGAAKILAWLLDIRPLISLVPEWPAMSFASALMLVVSAAALALAARANEGRYDRMALYAAGAVLIASGLAGFLPFAADMNFGVPSPAPGSRMRAIAELPLHSAPTTAFNFALCGAALVAYARRRSGVAQLLGFLVFVVALERFAAFVFDSRDFAHRMEPGDMAVVTMFAFFLLGPAISMIHGDRGKMAYLTADTIGAAMARRLVPVVLVMPIVLGLLQVVGEGYAWLPSGYGAAFVTAAITVIFLATIVRNAVLLVDLERRRDEAENEVREANRVLEERVALRTHEVMEKSRDLETFAYSVSHDLRAPLRAIAGYSRILIDEHEHADPRVAELLGRVESNAIAMARLIEDLIEYARLGGEPLRPRSISMERLVTGAINDLRERHAGRNIEWIVGELPPCQADPAAIGQLLANLLANAVKFTSEREAARIEVNGAPKGSYVVYEILDNGVGFDMRYASKLFDVFHRLHPQSRFPGTGIGLAICKRVVERHQGWIEAEGAVNEGATFRFALPPAAREVTPMRPREGRAGGARN